MMSCILPFNEANVAKDQPWLTPEDQESVKRFGESFWRPADMEPYMVEHLRARVAEGDQEAIRKLHPLCHYILTEDFRIVQEINVIRWGIFMEKAKHRFIDKTTICDGKEREFPSFDRPSWAQQHRRKHNPPRRAATWVSTVFLGHDEDMLFETMIFGGWLDQIPWRSSTLLEAKKCHWEAVLMARRLNNYMKRHGRRCRKDWLRMAEFWRLAHVRGRSWAIKKMGVIGPVFDRLNRIPGDPPIPDADWLVDMAQHFIGRPTLAK